ncbi:MAG TPA: hypothetical protein PKE26_01630 [Kiritimatiellia bacterium]|nr:hypothetical protein [Kiritimatiellia bacterium]HMO97790.1 hypothetical protein [Kiritimatiellia bacterium]HMP96382.1 hypothetical protein [Kiritimatiellia bacterium]
MADLNQRRVGRVLTLVCTHALVLYDAYILPLPMAVVMWKHGHHSVIYFLAVALVFPSFFRWRNPWWRDRLYIAGLVAFYGHWYLISSADDIAYGTEPFTMKGILGSLPFQIAFAVQMARMVPRCIASPKT